MNNDILGSLGEAVILLRADGSMLSEDLKKEKKRLEGQIDKISDSLKNTGRTLTASVTVPIVAMGAAAVAAGLKMDDAFDTIRIKTGATGVELKALQHDFKEVFANVPDDAKVVADTLSIINTRLGLTGKGLQDFTTQLLTMSRITGTDVKANVDAATRSFNAWQISTEKQGEALDFVFKVAQETGASVTDLMTSVTDAQGTFKNLNMTFEESVALLGQMNKVGVDTSSGIAALKRSVASFAEAGIPANEGLKKTFELIQSLGPGSKATSLAIDVFGAKAGPQLAVAIQQGRLSVDQLMKTVKASGETIMGAAKDTDGFSEKLLQLKNKAIIALEPLGTKLLDLGERALPVLVKMGEAVASAIDWFSKLPGPVQNVALAIAGLAAATGPIMMAVGSFTNLKNIVSILRLTELPGLATAFSVTNAAMLRSGALLGVLGVGAISLGTGFLIAKNDMDKFLATQQREHEVAETGIKDRIRVGESYDAYIKRLRETADLHARLAAGGFEPLTGGIKIDPKSLGLTQEDVAKATKSATDELEKFQKSLLSTKQKQEEAAAAARKHEEEIAKLRAGLEAFGLVTKASVNARLKEFADLEKYAVEQGVPLNNLLAQMELELLDMYDAAKKSGIGVDDITQALERIRVKLGRTTPALIKIGEEGEEAFRGIAIEVKHLTKAEIDAVVQAQNLELAQKELGIKSREELQKTAERFKRQYQLMLESGLYTTLQLQDAWNRVQEAVDAANGLNSKAVKEYKLLGQAAQLASVALDEIGENASDSGKAAIAFGRMVVGALEGIAAAATTAQIAMGTVAYIIQFATSQWVSYQAEVADAEAEIRGITRQLREMGIQAVETSGSLENQVRLLRRQLRMAEVNLDRITTTIEGMQSALARFGGSAPAQLQPYINRLLESNRLSAEHRAFLEGMAQGPTWQTLQEAAERYNLSLDSLGSGFEQLKANDTFDQSFSDWKMFEGIGANMNDVIAAMGPRINEMLNRARQFGTAIPEFMRPMLETMLASGALIDENGVALKDLTGFKFDASIISSLEKLEAALDRILAALIAMGDLGDGTLIPKFPHSPAPFTGQPIVGGIGKKLPQFAAGGVANFGSGTLAMLHGKEAVVPLNRMHEVMGGTSSNLNANDLVKAMRDAGFDRPNINFAPVLEGALANEMNDFASKMWPVLIRVLQTDGTIRSSLAGTIGVS